MSNIFAGLENLGFKNVEKVDVYQESDSEKKKQEAAKQGAKKETNEEDLLFDKSYTCPVCDHEFKSRMVRTGKVRLVGADSDLRPRYMGVDSLKYDAILCPKCGYAALNRYFNFVMSSQAKNTRRQGLEILLIPEMIFSFLSLPYFKVILMVWKPPSSTMSYFAT